MERKNIEGHKTMRNEKMNGKEWENVRKNDKERKKYIIYEQEE